MSLESCLAPASSVLTFSHVKLVGTWYWASQSWFAESERDFLGTRARSLARESINLQIPSCSSVGALHTNERVYFKRRERLLLIQSRRPLPFTRTAKGYPVHRMEYKYCLMEHPKMQSHRFANSFRQWISVKKQQYCYISDKHITSNWFVATMHRQLKLVQLQYREHRSSSDIMSNYIRARLGHKTHVFHVPNSFILHVQVRNERLIVDQRHMPKVRSRDSWSAGFIRARFTKTPHTSRRLVRKAQPGRINQAIPFLLL
jgi:hypothetical protein